MKTCASLSNIIKERKLPTLFIGSGISKRYISEYPDWNKLLLMVADKIRISQDRYYNIVKSIEDEQNTTEPHIINPIIADKLSIELKNQIDLGKLQYSDVFTNEQKNKMFKYKYNPFKYLVSIFFQGIIPNVKLNELQIFKKLRNSVSTIITTNYDKFIEEVVFENNFDIFNNQKSYYSNQSQGIGEIYKIHGTVSDPNSIILTSNDYKNFKENSKLVSAKLLSLLCDSPFIFMGYSLNDKNINNILSDFTSCIIEDDISLLSKNLIFIEYKEGEENLIEGNHSIQFNNSLIPFTKITTDNYQSIYDNILMLTPTLKPCEVRKLKQSIRKIILENNAGAERILATDVNTFEMFTSSNTYAIYFGTKNEIDSAINSRGIYSIKIDTFLLDALFESKIKENIVSADAIFTREILKKANQHIPYYYYIKNSKYKYEELLPEIKEQIDKLYSNLVSRTTLKTIKNVTVFNNIKDLFKAIQAETNNTKIANLLLKNIPLFECGNDLRKELQTIYQSNNGILTVAVFKKLILLCDSPNFNNEKQKIKTKRKDAEAL